MANLSYWTRGNNTPQGKPRVYFCCHPKDFKVYFESISEEILALQNCAIWYKTEDTEMDDEFFDDLEQMQLFVMPVTTELLTTENTAMIQEFPFAIARHIPVLPLMQESKLEELFNQKCGDLQFLDKHSSDSTAIPYEEKLKKYLESVLFSDELAEKIRDAFDTYVFLSYRKKDRRYAQELMRLIHKNDSCRDIALWYDEFLTPGENFNDAISDALKKSQLFVLTVTPNLVNEINYIMTTEYPMAQEEGKPILPVELLPTDRNALLEKYEDIPACTDAHDEEALSSALLEAIKNLAIRRNDSPEHDFFIGLAYLGGVDVEVDHTRAVALIRSAAEADVPEAIQKLVSMYNTGEGVQRDYIEAVQWQRKLVAYFRRCYVADNSEKNAEKLFLVQCDLSDSLFVMGQLAEAKAIYEEMRDFCGEAVKTYDFRHNMAISNRRLGNIAIVERNLAEAKAYYVKALELVEPIAMETRTVEARRDLSISYDKLGDIAIVEGNLAEAKAYYVKAYELREAIESEMGAVEAQRDLSISYERLGNIAKAEGNLAEAKAYYVKAYELREAIATETGTVKARYELTISYDKIGSIAEAEGNLAKAKRYYAKGLKLREAIATEMGTVEARRGLSISYNNLGDIAKAEGNLVKAKAYYAKGLELREAIAVETGTVEARRSLSISYNNLGDIAKAEGNLVKAKAYYAKGLELREAIAMETGTVEARRDLARSYERLGDIAKGEGNLTEAKAYYVKNMELREAIETETGTVETRRNLSRSYSKLGDIDEAEGDFAHAASLYYMASTCTDGSEQLEYFQKFQDILSRIDELFRTEQEYVQKIFATVFSTR